MKQIEVEYKRYCDLCEFMKKPTPLFEEYLLMRGEKLEDHLTEEELEDARRNIEASN